MKVQERQIATLGGGGPVSRRANLRARLRLARRPGRRRAGQPTFARGSGWPVGAQGEGGRESGRTVERERARGGESPAAPQRARTKCTGFTLLELVVAFTILGLMAGIIFSSFRLAVNSYTKSQNRLQEEARARVLQDFIKRQIGSLYPLRPTGSFLQQQSGLNQMPQSNFALTQIPLFYGVNNAVTFITVAPLMFQENPGLAVVRYGASQDERGRLYLGAMETPFTGLESFNLMVQAPRGKPLPLIEKVKQVQFQYYGWDSQGQRYGWFQTWNGEETHAVPSAIRIDYDDKHILVPINATFFGGSFLGGLQNLIQR